MSRAVSLHLYCTCGAAWSGVVAPETAAKRIEEVFERIHSGPGHMRCTAKQARAARLLPEVKSA